MTTDNWIALIGILFSAIIGYLVKYLLDKKARFSSDNATIKRDMYEGYINFIMSFINRHSYTTGKKIKQITEKAVVAKMQEFHRMAILYSSPRVINAFADFLQYSYKHPKGDGEGQYTMVLVTNIFKEMRRDIGLSNSGLGDGAIRLVRPIINDYDTVIRPLEFGLSMRAKQAASKEDNGGVKND